METSFHFLRPGWLFALLPAAALALLAWRRLGVGGQAWAKLVDAHLLRHLALQDGGRARLLPVAALLAGWAIAAVAMAGPTWRKLPTPVLDRLDPTVVVLSLAQSMNATDQSPSRLAAARHKVEDILRRMRGGEVGLVIFADRPFVASPLTEDGRVVAQMLPELATDLMPVLDNRPDIAIAQAIDLLKGADAPAGRIVLITDGPGDAPEFAAQAATAAARAGYELSVIGVGSQAGSPLLAYDGSPLRGRDGAPLSTRMDAAGLKRLATAGGGTFTPMTADGRDLDAIFSRAAGRPGDLIAQNGLTADQWADMGPYLLLGLLALAPLAFRRGWIAVLLLTALPLAGPREAAAQEAPAPSAGMGETWRGLWQTPDQQGADAFAGEDYKGAGARFADPAWRASALYKAGDYGAAADAFAGVPDGDYNRGNALARAGQLEEAIAAYDAALKAKPDDPDALYNRNLVQKLLDQKKKDEDDKKKDEEKKKKDQQDQKGPGQGQPKDDNGKGDQKNDPKKDGKPDEKKPGDQGKGDQDKGEQTPKDQNKDQGKEQPKPGDQDKGEQKKDQSRAGDQSKPEPKPSEGDKAGQKDKDKPAPSPGADPRDAAAQPPGPPAPPNPPDRGQPQPAQGGAQPPQTPPPAQAAPPAGPGALSAQQARAEADQTKEQLLRMVPDDPAGLLRARIRSHYYLGAPPGVGEQ